jgi:hypothetical protein
MSTGGAGALLRAGTGILGVLLLCVPALGSSEESAQAVWTPRELTFVYQGFTSHFSCDGLRDEVRAILLELGARKDLTVTEASCSGLPAVSIKMHVLTPAAQGQPPASVAAHWREVNLLAHQLPRESTGRCDLYEEIKKKILPLFTVRNLDYAATCVPHQVNLASDMRFKGEVLAADRPPDPAS